MFAGLIKLVSGGKTTATNMTAEERSARAKPSGQSQAAALNWAQEPHQQSYTAYPRAQIEAEVLKVLS